MEDKNKNTNTFSEEDAVVRNAPRADVSDIELGYDKSIFEKTDDVTEGLGFAPTQDELPQDIDIGESALAFHGIDAQEQKDKPKVKKKIKYIKQ